MRGLIWIRREHIAFHCHRFFQGPGTAGSEIKDITWLRPHGRRSAQEIAAEFSTALLRGLIRDETIRVESPLGAQTTA